MPKHIMVIDDSREILQLFEQILQDAGYEVVLDVYTRDIDLYTHLQTCHPDLVILDCSIKNEIQSMDLIDKIKLNSNTATIPIIVCTTETKKKLEDIRRRISRKQARLLPKPFDLDDLLKTIERLLLQKELLSRHAKEN